MKKLTILLLGICLLEVSYSQDLRYLYYSNDNLPSADLFILQDGFKVITTVSENNKSEVSTVLLRDSNVIIDTLKSGIKATDFFVIEGNEKIQIAGYSNEFSVRIENGRLLYNDSGKVNLPIRSTEFRTMFNDHLIVCDENGIRKVARDDSGEYSSNSESMMIYSSKGVQKIKPKLIRQLPYIFGMSKDSLYVYYRNDQTLISINSFFETQEFTINTNKDRFMGYFYDQQFSNHFFVKTSSDKNELFQFLINEQKFVFLKDLDFYPSKIVGGHLLHCDGQRQVNCDFYLFPIYSDTEQVQLNILDSVNVIDRN